MFCGGAVRVGQGRKRQQRQRDSYKTGVAGRSANWWWPENATLVPAARGTYALLLTLAAHCLASVLLIYAVRTRRQLWFWLSFAYKALIDTFAAWAILAWKMPGSTTKTAKLEVVVAIFALIALVALPKLKPGFIRSEQRESTSAASASPASI